MPAPRRRTRILTVAGAPAVLALLTLAAFANTLRNGYVGIDHWQVESGGLLVRSWPDLLHTLVQPLGAQPGWDETAPYARPFVNLALSTVHLGAGTAPWAYHAFSVGLHVANVLVAYAILLQLGSTAAIAFTTAALFAVHPLQTAAVAWISGIADPLCAFFMLVALYCELAEVRRAGSPGWRVAALSSFFLALASKETAFTLPLLIFIAYDVGLVELGEPRHRRRRALRSVLPYAAVVVLFLAYRTWVLAMAAAGMPQALVPLAVRLRTLPRLLLDYAWLPLRLNRVTVCDDFALSTTWDIASLAALAFLVVLTVFLWRLRRRAPLVVYGAAWMLLGLLPALNLVPILHYRADRFMYWPLLGWSLAVVAGVHAGARARPKWGRWLVLPTATLLLALVWLTHERNRLFRDDVTLYTATLQTSPHCREAHTALGDAYLRAGRAKEAALELEQALDVEPGRASYAVVPQILINLGFAHLAEHRYADAVGALAKAHALQPRLAHPLFGLGLANLAQGNIADGARWLEQANALQPNDPDITLDLARAYDQLGQRDAAKALYERYLASWPDGRAAETVRRRLNVLSGAGS